MPNSPRPSALNRSDKLKEARASGLTRNSPAPPRQKVKRLLLDRLDEAHRFEAPPSLVEEEFKLMWNSDQGPRWNPAARPSADEDTTEMAAEGEYRKIADRRVRLWSGAGRRSAKRTRSRHRRRSQPRGDRARRARCRAAKKEVWDYYRNNAGALAQLRAPIYEDKVVDFILELADVTRRRSRARSSTRTMRRRTARLTRPPASRMCGERRVARYRRYAVLARISFNSLGTRLPGLVTG